MSHTFLYYFKEYDIMQLIAGVIAGLITWWAMWFIDNQNKKRWLTEAYVKEEAKNWIEYNVSFENISRRLMRIIDSIDTNSFELYMGFEASPYKYFEELEDECKKLYFLLNKLRPYYELKDKITEFENESLLIKTISVFFGQSAINIKNGFLNIEENDDEIFFVYGHKYIIRNAKELLSSFLVHLYAYYSENESLRGILDILETDLDKNNKLDKDNWNLVLTEYRNKLESIITKLNTQIASHYLK